ncbi:MAG: cyclodeaminase/cyclohydrolase family protein [Phycisphaerae bacterium]|nr:cyclodeaminase/cyclohydrolase family protein [Phycisphaerae bacterium]
MTSLAAVPFGTLLEQVAAKTPTPGGGAVASAVGALAAALAGMVVSFSLGKKSLAPHAPALEDARARLERARALMLRLADEDAAAYGLCNELSRLPETDPRRAAEHAPALRACVQIPEAVAAACVDLLRLMDTLGPITNRHLRSDLGLAAELAEAAVRASNWNVWINSKGLPAPEAVDAHERSRQAGDSARDLLERVRIACRD